MPNGKVPDSPCARVWPARLIVGLVVRTKGSAGYGQEG